MRVSARSIATVLGVIAVASIGLSDRAQGSRAAKNIAFTEDGYPYIRGEYLVKVRSGAALERLLDQQYESVRCCCASDSAAELERFRNLVQSQCL